MITKNVLGPGSDVRAHLIGCIGARDINTNVWVLWVNGLIGSRVKYQMNTNFAFSGRSLGGQIYCL